MRVRATIEFEVETSEYQDVEPTLDSATDLIFDMLFKAGADLPDLDQISVDVVEVEEDDEDEEDPNEG